MLKRLEVLKEKILAYALENAIAHGGKARVDAVLSRLFQEGLHKEDIKEVSPKIVAIVKDVNSLKQSEQESKFSPLSKLVKKRESVEKELPELENVKGKVVLRLCPFPSGPLHIGNARQAILNDEYAKRYNGKFILIFDDTIGSKEKPIVKDAYPLIFEGLRWLDIKIDDTFYKSDRLNIYYEHALKLIKNNKAYVCLCSPEKLKKNRINGIECKCRSNSVSENIKAWQYMLAEGKEGQFTLRIKTDMQHENPAFRDRVLFRISQRKHPRTGNRYKVWPLLDFSMAIDDHLLGITHIIRGKELMMEGTVEELIWDIFGWPHPTVYYTGLLQLKGLKLSKSKFAKEVKSKKYRGWDDPRTFSLQSLARRGIQPEALRAFILQFGLHQNEITVPIDMLYTENKKIIERSDRYFFVADPVKITIENSPKLKASVPLHPQDPKRGSRKFETGQQFYITKGDLKEIKSNKICRLMNLLNFSKKGNKFVFHSIEHKPDLKAKLIHWLPCQENLVKAKVLMLDGGYVKGLAEAGIAKLKEGTIVQFERFGFCRLVKKNTEYEFWFTQK